LLIGSWKGLVLVILVSHGAPRFLEWVVNKDTERRREVRGILFR